MRFIYIAAMLVVAASVAGCTTVTKEEFASVHTALSGSPKFRQSVTGYCVATVNGHSLSDRQKLADLINVDVKNLPGTFCRRYVRALASGRVTYGDLKGRTGSPNFIRAIQGR